MSARSSGAATPDRSRRASDAPSRSGVWLTDALLLLMALIWGVNFSVVKHGTQVMPPLAFNGARMTLAVVALLLVVWLRRHRWPSRRDLWALAGLGVLGHGLYQVVFVQGVALTRAGDAALVIAAAPAFIALIGRMRGVEQVTHRGAVGIVLSLVGIGLVVFGGTGGQVSADAANPLVGDLLVLVSALCWAVYTVLLKPFTERIDGVMLSAVTLLGGVVPLLLVATPQIARTPWLALPPSAWGAIGYSGLLAMVVAYLCWYRGVRVLGPTTTAMFANLQPLIALVFAWVTLGEAPRIPQLLGGAAIMGGLLLTRAPVAPLES